MAAEATTPALRTRLLVAMGGPLLLAAVVIGVLGGALSAIVETVQVEGGAVTLDLPAAAFGMLENSERDNVYYRIAVGGELLTGYAGLPAPDPATLDRDPVQPIDNGIRYNRPGGTVAVSIGDAPAGGSVAVADDGPGLSPAQRETAFERFIRFGTGDGPEGSELGLAIVRSAADRMKASVGFGAGDEGTTIILRFPPPGA